MRRFTTVSAAIALTCLLMMMLAPDSGAVVTPESVEETVGAGDSITIDKLVELGEVPDVLDLMLVVDVSGSYSDDLPNITSLAPGLYDELAAASDVQVGLASFRDHLCCGGPPAYQLNQQLTTSKDDWLAALGALSATGGGDGPESQYEAVYQAATGAGNATGDAGAIPAGQGADWRPGAAKVIVITTDAPFHTPDDGTGWPGPDRDTVVDALNAESIQVVALQPSSIAEMEDLAAATSGSVQMTDASSSEVATAILAGLEEIQLTITPAVDEECALDISFSPTAVEGVKAGQMADFDETIAVPVGTAPGVYQCTVSFGPAGTQDVAITVPAPTTTTTTAPVVEVSPATAATPQTVAPSFTG